MGHIAFNTIGVLMKKSVHVPKSIDVLLSKIAEHGVSLLFHTENPYKDYNTFTATAELDALLVLGGDGTIIKVIREIADKDTPILSINLGTVGFMADMSIEEAIEALPEVLHGKALKDTRAMLTTKVIENGKTVFEEDCINDVVLAKGKIARLIDIEACIDGKYLTDYNADGLMISTPTGSTAYNLSAGGPIVHPTVQAMIITAINPYSLSQKPIVVPGTSNIMLRPKLNTTRHDDEAVYLTIDGQVFKKIEPNMTIEVSLSSRVVTFLRKEDDSFFHTLRTKLKWGDKPTINQLPQDQED